MIGGECVCVGRRVCVKVCGYMCEYTLSSLQFRCRMWRQAQRTDLTWTRPSMTLSESLGECSRWGVGWTCWEHVLCVYYVVFSTLATSYMERINS